ncbi:hypothetical protein IWQ62_004888 [Dispira parvispora]|uniref:Uncharacterized protein n=1 Tax=Dispira parvispora TaxID=1520584 RepID=A0A9W8AKS3_9FUNG|nr:hypothetical protein IWQ62_004888 [Dispira parvispora]
MSDLRMVTEGAIYHIQLMVRVFTGDLEKTPWKLWLTDAEKAIELVLPKATDDTKYIVIKQVLDPAIVTRLKRQRVETWNDLVKNMNRKYPLYLWQKHYLTKIIDQTLFDNLEVDIAISLATKVVEYLEHDDFLASRTMQGLLCRFQDNLATAPLHIWETNELKAEDLKPRMEEVRAIVKADLVRRTCLASRRHPGSDATRPASGTKVDHPTRNSNSTRTKKKSRVQKLKEKLEALEKENDELRKKLAEKAGG